jgi:hypothetical protein
LNITESELEMLAGCQTSSDWTRAVTEIKEARNDEYPPDWWQKVKMSGLMDKVLARWGDSSELKLSTIPAKSTCDTIKSMAELVPSAMVAMKLKLIADLAASGFTKAQIELLTDGLDDSVKASGGGRLDDANWKY